MMSQTGKQLHTIHILANVLISKGNQTITFGQLIECSMRRIFLEKSSSKFGGEISARIFSKKSKSSITVDQQPKIS